MKKLTIRLRIIVSFALVVSLLMVVSANSLFGLLGLGRAMALVTEETTPVSLSAVS